MSARACCTVTPGFGGFNPVNPQTGLTDFQPMSVPLANGNVYFLGAERPEEEIEASGDHSDNRA